MHNILYPLNSFKIFIVTFLFRGDYGKKKITYENKKCRIYDKKYKFLNQIFFFFGKYFGVAPSGNVQQRKQEKKLTLIITILSNILA